MASKCPSCGSDSIELDDSTAEVQYACTSCGRILEEFFLVEKKSIGGTSYFSNEGNNCTPNVSDPLKKFTNFYASRGKKQGLEKIEHLASIFNFSLDMKERAKNLFCYAYNYEFLRRSINKKLLLAGCCVHAVMKQYGRPIIHEEVCQYFDCTSRQYYAVYRHFKQCSNIVGQLEATDELDAFVHNILKDMKIDEKEKMLKKTMKIINICYECWVTVGKSRKHTIIAAAYIAWRSSDYSHLNKKLSEFFSEFHFPKGLLRTSSLRCKEMIQVFIKHAEKLPWMDRSVNDKNVFLHIDHVLLYFKSLHRKVKESSSDNEQSFSEVKEPVTTSEGLGGNFPYPRRDDGKEIGSSDEEEISDSEIEMYIRTKKEVAELLKFKTDLK